MSKLQTFTEQDTTGAELKTWILKRIKKNSERAMKVVHTYRVDSDCIARYSHCAETYSPLFNGLFRQFLHEKRLAQMAALALPLCGVISMRMGEL